MVVLESIRSAVKIKVEGTSAPRQTLEGRIRSIELFVKINRPDYIVATTALIYCCYSTAIYLLYHYGEINAVNDDRNMNYSLCKDICHQYACDTVIINSYNKYCIL